MEQVTKQSLEDINLGELRVNQAFLNITSHHSAKLWMYTLSEDCVRVSNRIRCVHDDGLFHQIVVFSVRLLNLEKLRH